MECESGWTRDWVKLGCNSQSPAECRLTDARVKAYMHALRSLSMHGDRDIHRRVLWCSGLVPLQLQRRR